MWFTRRIRPATLRAVERALRALPADWTLFFLGHWPLAAFFVRHNVLRTSSGCSHAYIANPRLLRWLRDIPEGSGVHDENRPQQGRRRFRRQ